MKKPLLRYSLILLFILPVSFVQAASQHTITGFIYDSISGYGIPNQKVYFLYEDSTSTSLDSVITAQGGIYSFDTLLPDSGQNTLKVFTFGCDNYKYEQTISNPGALEFAFFTICFLTPTPNCEASFFPNQDSLYPLRVYFSNTSTGLINTYLWDFGDSTYSTELNPEHTYLQPGSYQVSLSNGNTMNPLYTCSVIQTVVISPMCILAGQILANQFPIQAQAKVILYRVISSDWIAIDTSYVDSQGVYYFYQIPQGNYSLRAIPTDPELAKHYFPTYFHQALTWHDAALISLHDSTYTNSFELKPKPEPMGGTGALTGHIVYTNGTSTVAAPDIELMVFSTSQTGIDYNFSSADGSYLIGGLLQGNYMYYAELPGNTASYFIYFTIGNPAFDTVTVNLFIQNNTIGIEDINKAVSMLNVYPNPAPERVTIELQSDRIIRGRLSISDFTGSVIQTEDILLINGRNRIEKDLSGFSRGLYFINVDLGKSGRICRRIIH